MEPQSNKLPQARKIQFFLQKWQEITQDSWVLDTIQGYTGATSNTVTTVCIQPGEKPGDYTGDRISSEEGSCSSFSISKGGGLHKQCLLGTQEQGKMEANSQFEGLEPVRDP